jgi:hypothetical protein
LKLETLALSVEIKARASDPAPAAASLDEYLHRGPGAARVGPRDWGQDWGHFGGSVAGFRLPPAAPSG